MSNHIQSIDKARSFIEAYYSAEMTTSYVDCFDGVYGISLDKTSLRTKDISKLAREALEHISNVKDMIHLFNALEKHIARLDPTIVRIFRKIRFPCIDLIKGCVLLLPFTASFSLGLTIGKVYEKITKGVFDRIKSDDDLEDFCLLEEWLKNHPDQFNGREDLSTVVASCKTVVARIKDAQTIQELLEIPDIIPLYIIYGYDFEGGMRVRSYLFKALEKKIQVHSLQILNLKTDAELSRVSRLIEKFKNLFLPGNFQDTVDILCGRIKERIALETTLEGLFKVYESVGYDVTSKFFYESFFEEKVFELISSQIHQADTLEKLFEIYKSVGLPSKVNLSLKFKIDKLIGKRLKEILSFQLNRIDTFDRLLEIITCMGSITYPFSIVVSNCQGLASERIKKIVSLEIERSDTFEAVAKIDKFIKLLSYDFNNAVKDLKILIDDKKESICLMEISRAKTDEQLRALREGLLGRGIPSGIFSRILESIRQREKDLNVIKGTFLGIAWRMKKCFDGSVNEKDRLLLQKLPEGNLLRAFAENIPVAIRDENLALVFGLQDFSDKAKVKSALRAIKLQVHPDKNTEEYKQIATRLWNVFQEIEKYLKQQRLVFA